MQKQVPNLGRLFVMVAFALSCFGLLLFLWLAFGGSVPLKPKRYQFKIPFQEATQLAREADVRISGVPVGKVKRVDLARNGRNVALVELDPQYAPIASDARAILRQKTLLGETYVELTPGTSGAPKLKEGGTLSPARVSPTVELDEILRALDERTRNSFRVWMQTLAQGVQGRGRDLSDALGNLAPLAEDTDDLLRILASQEGAVQRLVRNTGVVFGALAERRGQLQGLIRNANTVFQTTADRNASLQAAFVALPTFERESRLTLLRLNRFALNANPVVSDLRPAARELSPTLIDLAGLAPDLKALFRDLNPLIDASRAGIPAIQRILRDLRPLLGQLDPFLRNVIPITDFLAPFKRELTGFFGNTVAATEATDQPGTSANPVHYLRTTNPSNPESLAVYPNRIGSNRPNPYMQAGGFTKLPQNLDVYENRQCGRPVPVVSNSLLPGLPGDILTLVGQFAFGGQSNTGQVPAPVCRKQAPFTFHGFTGSYPHVTALPPQ